MSNASRDDANRGEALQAKVDLVAELQDSRRAALNVMEDAIAARDALRASEAALQDRENWLRGQREAMESVLDGGGLQESLGLLVRTATDALGEGARAAFYLADADGETLHHVVGMTDAYAEAVNGFRVGPESLACGASTHRGKPILTMDVRTDPRWGDWREIADRFDYRGCWNFPIRTSVGHFVGTFAAYLRRPREATPRDLELASFLIHTAAIIIARHREAEARQQAERALHEGNQRLRLALSAARMGTWTWDVDADTHIRDANLNALLGLPAADMTTPFAEFLAHIHPDDRDMVRSSFDQSVRHGQPLNVEFRVVASDGAIRWLRDQGDGFGPSEPVRLAGACVDVTDLKEAEATLQLVNDDLERHVTERTSELASALDALENEMARRRELARRLSTAQEDERRRVARDLHDTVGQLMTGLSLALKAAERADELPNHVVAKIDEARQLMGDLSREVHALAVRIRPTALDDFGLEAALAQLVAEWSSRTGVPAAFHAAGLGPDRLTEEIETAVYRIVQEALTNIAKHANATDASVVVTRPDGHVSVVIEDDGSGFDPDSPPKGRLGLVGIRERAELVGGDLAIESTPGSGTALIVRLPIPEIGEAGPLAGRGGDV